MTVPPGAPTNAGRRILVLNPNTTQAVTERMLALGRSMTGDEVTWIGQTARFGVAYISDRVGFTIAGHATLDAFAPHASAVDAVLIGCFGDPGLLALRDLAGVPVIGLAEASFAAAAQDGRRFAIVTGGRAWEPMLAELARGLGYADICLGIRTIALTGGQIAADPQAAVGALVEACGQAARETGADTVILGGAGLAGLKASIAPAIPVPLVCSVEAGLAAVLRLPGAKRPAPAPKGRATLALAPDLARLL